MICTGAQAQTLRLGQQIFGARHRITDSTRSQGVISPGLQPDAHFRRSARVTAPWILAFREESMVIQRATGRWRGRLPCLFPRGSATRCRWSRSDARAEVALPQMRDERELCASAKLLGAPLKACAGT